MHKSELVELGLSNTDHSLSRVLGFEASQLPIKYLDIPLEAKHKDGRWEPIIGMFQNRLVNWKRKFLSKNGRLTLIKGTLSNLLIYSLLVLTILAKVVKRLESIQCNFLWGRR